MPTQAPEIFPGILVPIFCLIATGICSYLLAKDKERNVVLWTIIGFIPVINWFALPYFMGASNLRIERKIDELINKN